MIRTLYNEWQAMRKTRKWIKAALKEMEKNAYTACTQNNEINRHGESRSSRWAKDSGVITNRGDRAKGGA